MTLSFPSFLAASMRAAIPPRSVADFADEALAPVLSPSGVLAGGEQAAMPIRVIAARAATHARRAGRDFTSDLRVGWGSPPQANPEVSVPGAIAVSGVDAVA